MLCTTTLPWLKHLDPTRLASGIQEQHEDVHEDEITFIDVEDSNLSFYNVFFLFSSSVMITAFIGSTN